MTVNKNDKRYLEIALGYLCDEAEDLERKINDLESNYDFDDYPQIEQICESEKDDLFLLEESIKVLGAQVG